MLRDIQKQVKELIAPVDYLSSSTAVKRPLSEKNQKFKLTVDKTGKLTGFLIDCVDKVVIYVESSSLGSIKQIWMNISSMGIAQGHILYDSSLMFLNRLHQPHFRYGYFYTIALRESPQIILSKVNTYQQGNIPIPAWKSLINLHKLTQCLSIRTASRDNLFPDSHSLYSLDIEFGVPFKLHNRKT